MFQKLSNSWELAKASYSVLRADKELIVFPLVSAIATLAVIVVFAVPALLVGVFDQVANDGDPGVAGYVIGFLFYLAMYFVMIFSNSALVGAALIRLRGGDPTLRDGFQIAMDHLPQIFGYALISATVGVILNAIRERAGILGSLVGWLGAMAWNLATFLVVPVLVVENVGPVEAIKRSASLLKQTWGEQIAGNFGLGLVFGLITLAALIPGVVLIALAVATESAILIVLAILLVVALVAGIALLGSTLQGIYVAAVYRYAVEGAITPQYFRAELVQNAFRPK